MWKNKITSSIYDWKKRPGRLIAKLVLGMAFCAFLASCFLYWQGRHDLVRLAAMDISGERALSQAAQGEGMRLATDVLSAVLAQEAAQAEDPEAAMTDALRRVYPGLSQHGYFVLWRGTVDICSPLTPDTSGLDFGLHRDIYGHDFVAELARLAKQGGGFTSFTLSRPIQEQKHSYGLEAPSAMPSTLIKIPYMAYAAPIPGTDVHLTLWRQDAPALKHLQAELSDDQNWSALGLCMAGLSFLGISILLRNFDK